MIHIAATNWRHKLDHLLIKGPEEDLSDYEDLYEDSTIIESLCGQSIRGLYCITKDAYIQWVEYGITIPICQECMKTEEMAFALLKTI